MEQIGYAASGAPRGLPYAQSDDAVRQRCVHLCSVLLSLVEFSYPGQVVYNHLLSTASCLLNAEKRLDIFISVINVNSFFIVKIGIGTQERVGMEVSIAFMQLWKSDKLFLVDSCQHRSCRLWHEKNQMTILMVQWAPLVAVGSLVINVELLNTRFSS